MALFRDIALTSEDYFRAVVLYGRNVASYKFALAESLIQLASQGKDFATLGELAIPFSDAICRHLETEDKQTTSRTSTFLNQLRKFNRNEIDDEEKLDSTIRLGFVNVIDAFHVVGTEDVKTRFFRDDRKSSRPGIQLTDELLEMVRSRDSVDLTTENESRWNMVEFAWANNTPIRLVTLDFDERLESFFGLDKQSRRRGVTNARHALNGYQRGKCFYCNNQIFLGELGPLSQRGEVDHFFPHVLQRNGGIDVDLDQAWNLVLACNRCNGAAGKRDLCPALPYVEDLNTRNEYLISSHHPLRESIIARTGNKSSERRAFLQTCYDSAKRALVHTWETLKMI